MVTEKTISMKFSEEEKTIINETLDFINGSFAHSEVCQELDCDYCPFRVVCDYSTADDIERKINNLLNN